MLIFSYVKAWAALLLFGAAAFGIGHRLVKAALGSVPPIEEHLSLALPLGALAFFCATFVLGCLNLLGPSAFWSIPALLLLLGGRGGWRFLGRLRRRARSLQLLRPRGTLELLIWALGLLGALLVWLPTLLPENASYDARWYHLPIAEHYVAEGAIRAFPEGWVLGAYPQLASVLDVWAFLAPGRAFDHVVLAAQLEAGCFVVALLGVCACVRRLLGKRSLLAWCGVFLFPGVFCYDSGLVLNADHVAAAFAPAIALLTWRVARRPQPGAGALLGACLAGALDTKYSAAICLPLPLLLLACALLRAREAGERRALLTGSAWAALSAAVFTSPHWLKNWLFYGDPFFPLLRAYLPAHPWPSFADVPFAASNWRARPTELGTGTLQMLRTLVTFSFEPHEFLAFHGRTPVFGSLFSLSTPLLWFVRERRRLLGLYAGVYACLAVWFWLHAFDRYLQVLVPWMAAGTVSVLLLLWRRSAAQRWAVASLVSLQVAWGATVPFIPSHQGVEGGLVLPAVIRLVRQHVMRDPPLPFKEWAELAAVLPPHARVLIHEEEIHAGLGTATVMDYPGDQGGLYWGEPELATSRQIWFKLQQLGVTHLLWAEHQDRGADTPAGALAFFDFASQHTRRIRVKGGFVLAAVSNSPPPERPPGEVAYFACDARSPFAAGLYALSELARFPGDPRPISGPRPNVGEAEAIERAGYLVYDAGCRGPLDAAARESFELMAARGTAMLMRRRGPDARR